MWLSASDQPVALEAAALFVSWGMDENRRRDKHVQEIASPPCVLIYTSIFCWTVKGSRGA